MWRSPPTAAAASAIAGIFDSIVRPTGALGDLAVLVLAGGSGLLVYGAATVAAKRREAAPLSALILRVAPAMRRIPGISSLAATGDD